MKEIPPQIIEDSCHQVVGGSEEDLYRSMQQMEEEQPELLAFMVEFIDDLDEHAEGVALYMLVSIYRMFQEASEDSVPMVNPDEIIESFEYNEKVMEELEKEPSWDFWEATIREETASQPYVVGFVVEEIFPDVEGEEWKVQEELSHDDQMYIFLLTKTVIDVLDKKTR